MTFRRFFPGLRPESQLSLEVHKLEDQKKELVEENSQLEKKLKDLKGQVEQEVRAPRRQKYIF